MCGCPFEPRAAVVAGELVGPADSLAALAAELAERQRSPATRRTYAAVFRSFVGFLGPGAPRAAVTPAAVRAYRDALERAGRTVRSASVARGEPHALSHNE